MTSDEINAELTKAGIPFDPESHWKTRQKLLNEYREAVGQPEPESSAEPAESAMVDQSADTAPVSPPEPEQERAPEPQIKGVSLPADTGKEPPRNPMLGDKTPEVVAWRRANWTAKQFAEVYGGRKIDGKIEPKL